MVPKEFYNSMITERSTKVLRKLSEDLDFVLVGGWAVNFYVKTQKSLDVDIAIRVDKLDYFKQYGVTKYKNIGMYFATIEGINVDLMVEGISDADLTIPVYKVLSDYILIEGIKVASKCTLLLLKMSGYFSMASQKLEKDIIDVVSLLFYSGVNLGEVAAYIREYDIEPRKGFDGMLEYLGKGRGLWRFITDSIGEYDKLAAGVKADILKRIRIQHEH